MMNNFSFPTMAERLSYGWLWGKPEGLSDNPEGFRQFVKAAEGLTLIESTQVIRIDKISEETAVRLVGFLRYKPDVLHSEESEEPIRQPLPGRRRSRRAFYPEVKEPELAY